MDFELVPLCANHLISFKKDMQKAFQWGVIEGLGEMDSPHEGEMEILPEADIDHSLRAKGAAAYEAVVDGKPVGGAIVVIDEVTQHNHLDFLFVKVGAQSNHVGQQMWKAIEARYPETKVWETCTPYFEKRNIHFYVNRCGFHVVEFFNRYHPDPSFPDENNTNAENDSFDGMFRFEKEMRK